MLISNVVKLALLALCAVPFYIFQYNPDQGWRLLLVGVIIALQFVWGWFYSAHLLAKPTNKSSVRNHANGIKRRSPYWAALALAVIVWGILEWVFEVKASPMGFASGFGVFMVWAVGHWVATRLSQMIGNQQKAQRGR